MKTNKMVEIPVVTFNVLKKLVFDNEGINISPIVEDLAICLPEEKKELMGIHVVLTLKGLKPDLNIPRITFKSCWRGIDVYIYQGFSLIQGLCAFKAISINWRREGWFVGTVRTEVHGLDVVESLKESYESLEMIGIKEDENPDYTALTEVIQQALKANEENTI